jgi:hypothetical protein
MLGHFSEMMEHFHVFCSLFIPLGILFIVSQELISFSFSDIKA